MVRDVQKGLSWCPEAGKPRKTKDFIGDEIILRSSSRHIYDFLSAVLPTEVRKPIWTALQACVGSTNRHRSSATWWREDHAGNQWAGTDIWEYHFNTWKPDLHETACMWQRDIGWIQARGSNAEQSGDFSLQVASLLSRYVEEGKSKQQDSTCSMICSRVLSLNDFSMVSNG